MAPGMRLGSDDEEIKAAYSCAAAHSGKRLRSDENQASLLNACSGVVCIACDLFNKLAVDLEDLLVGAVKVHTVGKITQCLVAHPTKDWAFPVDIQNFTPSEAVKSSMCRCRGIAQPFWPPCSRAYLVRLLRVSCSAGGWKRSNKLIELGSWVQSSGYAFKAARA